MSLLLLFKSAAAAVTGKMFGGRGRVTISPLTGLCRFQSVLGTATFMQAVTDGSVDIQTVRDGRTSIQSVLAGKVAIYES
jgi:hypothetical protein